MLILMFKFNKRRLRIKSGNLSDANVAISMVDNFGVIVYREYL